MSVIAVIVAALACGRAGAEIEARKGARAPAIEARVVSTELRSSTTVDQAPSTHELAAAPDGVFAGRIVDVKGVERSLRLVLAPMGGDAKARIAGQRVSSELAMERGRFRFEGVPAGNYELRLCEELYCFAPLRIESDGRGVAGIELVAHVAVQVQIEIGQRGTVLIRDMLDRTWHEREHDGTALVALLPGEYRVEVADGRALEFTVRDEPVRLDLRE
ncbi:MAG: hypothetical protein HZA53_00890 [Planctomycetes bacterium]|nr:hypothetical protein [Planctomycetota bacterium]